MVYPRPMTVFLLVATAAASLVSAVSAAKPLIVQTACDTLSLNPPLVRVEFAIVNLDSMNGICQLTLIPIQSGPAPADSCRITECNSPPEWACQLWPTDGSAIWEVSSGTNPACILPGETLGPFAITLDPFFCCYEATFTGPVGGFVIGPVCFECEKPVQVQSSSWGRVKNTYR